METFELNIAGDDVSFCDTLLYKAIKSHDAALVLQEIYAGADVHVRDSNKRSYLHLVVFEATSDNEDALLPVIYQLSNAGAEVDVTDTQGQTPLEVALRRELQQIAVALLRVGADPRHKDYRAMLRNTGSPLVLELSDTLSRFEPGLWAAVVTDDAPTVQLLVFSWCRVHVSRDGQSLIQAARSTRTSTAVMATLDDFHVTMEFVHAALAGDERRMVEFLMDSKPCDPFIMDISHQESWSSPLTPRSLRDTARAMGHKHILPLLPEDDFNANDSIKGYYGGCTLETALKWHGNRSKSQTLENNNSIEATKTIGKVPPLAQRLSSKTRPMKAFPPQNSSTRSAVITPDIIAHSNDNNRIHLDLVNTSMEEQAYEQSKFGSVGLRTKSKSRKGLREVYSFSDDWLTSDASAEEGPISLADSDVTRIEHVATPRGLGSTQTANPLSKDYSKNWSRSSLKATLSKSRARTKEIHSKMCVIS